MEEDDEDRGVITAKDFMNDFATEDFIAKNMRVRPQSGVTRGDNDETRTQAAGDAGFSRMGGIAGEIGIAPLIAFGLTQGHVEG